MTKTFKKVLIAALAAASLVSGTAMATPILDTLIGGTGFDMRNAGDAAVATKFEQLTGLAMEQDSTYRDNTPTAVRDAASGLWVIDIAPGEAGYFMLKFGVGGTKTNLDTYFFQNVGDLSKLVFSDMQVNYLTGGDCAAGNDNRCNIGRLSHYVTADAGEGEVPEPASLALLGAGLASLMLRRRR